MKQTITYVTPKYVNPVFSAEVQQFLDAGYVQLSELQRMFRWDEARINWNRAVLVTQLYSVTSTVTLSRDLEALVEVKGVSFYENGKQFFAESFDPVTLSRDPDGLIEVKGVSFYENGKQFLAKSFDPTKYYVEKVKILSANVSNTIKDYLIANGWIEQSGGKEK